VKRFYKTAVAVPADDGHAVMLDGRPLKTPGRRGLVLPSLGLAAAVAAEWAAQGETVLPETMPLTRLANTVVDQLPAKRQDALDEIMGYAGADLLCYRQTSPADLAARQAATWQPWLDWLTARLEARLEVALTLEPIEQPAAAIEALSTAAAACDDWQLVGLHAATRLTSSIVLGLAMLEGELGAEAAFDAAMLEELYEIEHWGLEAEQARRHAALRRQLAATELYCRMLRTGRDAMMEQ
jgi:chaperone required for assembly of F1-ATPase